MFKTTELIFMGIYQARFCMMATAILDLYFSYDISLNRISLYWNLLNFISVYKGAITATL